MNFVIFSKNFLPLNDAEAFCTARFANALALSGHHVHVVTMDHPSQLPEDVCHELIPAIKCITRIRVSPAKKCFGARLYYGTPEWDAIDYGASIKALREVLHQYESPILISRMCPTASGIIAWHCRKDAALWIHHFSDPFPFYLKGGFLGSIMNRFTWRWGRRFMDDSDLVTITCNEVMDFIREKYGRKNFSKFHLLPHIGDPFLQANDWKADFAGRPFVAHAGNCYDGRYAQEIVRELMLLADTPYRLGFLQAGAMQDRDIALIRQSGIEFQQVSLNSPRQASAIFEQATVNLVIDLKVALSYTPFIPSKFVYLLFTDKPIVVFAKKSSWMYQLSKEYPEAGIIFADVEQEGDLANKIMPLQQHTHGEWKRTEIRKLFTGKLIVQNFLEKVKSLPQRDI